MDVSFVLERETPGAVRYQEVDAKGNARKKDVDGAVIGTLYLRKAAIKGPIQSRLTVTIKPATVRAVA